MSTKLIKKKLIKEEFNLIDILIELNYSDKFPDELNPALLLRTLFLIDSLHDFSDFLRAGYKREDAVNLCNNIINMYKKECYIMINEHKKYELLKDIFNNDNDFFFVFNELYSDNFFTKIENINKYMYMYLNNEIFKEALKKNPKSITKLDDDDTEINIMQFKGYIYSATQNLTDCYQKKSKKWVSKKSPERYVDALLIFYKIDKDTTGQTGGGQTKGVLSRNELKSHYINHLFLKHMMLLVLYIISYVLLIYLSLV